MAIAAGWRGAVFAAAAGLCLAAGPALAGDWTFCRKPAAPGLPDGDYLDVPGDPIFGFTDPTDVGALGDCGFAVEITGRAGKQSGSYMGTGSKYELSAVPLENLSLSFSAFSSLDRIRNVPGVSDRNGFEFDGLSTEIQYRVLKRSPTNALAITLATEPRWARTDPTSGNRLPTWGTEFKLLADYPLSANWFIAGNLNYAPAWVKMSDGSGWGHFSATNVSVAVTWGPNGLDFRFFIGVESRLLGGFKGLALGCRVTYAWFAGPNVLFYVTPSATLNFAWTPQIFGHERDTDKHRDLDNFERQQFRIKLAVGF